MIKTILQLLTAFALPSDVESKDGRLEETLQRWEDTKTLLEK